MWHTGSTVKAPVWPLLPSQLTLLSTCNASVSSPTVIQCTLFCGTIQQPASMNQQLACYSLTSFWSMRFSFYFRTSSRLWWIRGVAWIDCQCWCSSVTKVSYSLSAKTARLLHLTCHFHFGEWSIRWHFACCACFIACFWLAFGLLFWLDFVLIGLLVFCLLFACFLLVFLLCLFVLLTFGLFCACIVACFWLDCVALWLDFGMRLACFLSDFDCSPSS